MEKGASSSLSIVGMGCKFSAKSLWSKVRHIWLDFWLHACNEQGQQGLFGVRVGPELQELFCT